GHDTRAIQDYLGHRRSRRPCATPPSRRTLQGVLAGLRGLPGARTKKAHVGRNCTVSAADVGAWDGAVAVQQVLFPGHSLARARRGVWSLHALTSLSRRAFSMAMTACFGASMFVSERCELRAASRQSFTPSLRVVATRSAFAVSRSVSALTSAIQHPSTIWA